MLIVLLLSKKLCRTPSLVGFRGGMWPFARVGHLRTVSSPESENIPSRAVPRRGWKVDAEASAVWKRLQQANNVARERDAGSECRHCCRDLAFRDPSAITCRMVTRPARESYSSNGGPSPTPFGLGPVAKARIGENCQALRLWQRLLSFFVMAGPARMRPQQRIASALLIVAAWFGAYAFTWLSKWIIASWAEPTFDIGNDVMSTMQFRISGENAKVSHWPLAARQS
jgi:hypothetical protein